jgi:hypothetical protein
MLIIFGSLVLLILLAIFIPVILMIRKMKQQRRERDWLQQHGTRITAYVKYVILQGGESETRSDLGPSVGLLLDELSDASPRQIAYDQRMLSRGRPSSSRPQRYQITDEWVHPRTRETYTFQQTVYSGALPKDCDPLKLSQLTILIDPDNPKRYYMEFDTASYDPSYPAALTRKHFDEGRPVSFGTVTVSKQGVYDGHELYSWNYIVDVQPADNGILVTEKSRGTPRTFTLPITATQDIQTCLGLIRRGLK